MKNIFWLALVPALSFAAGKTQQWPADTLKWSESVNGGPQFAEVQGDRKKGAAQFFMRIAAGNDSGWHSHDAELTAVVVTGTIENIEQGAEADAKPLPSGSAWLQAAKKNHITKCAAGADCVFFVTSKGAFTFHPMTPEGKPAPAAKEK